MKKISKYIIGIVVALAVAAVLSGCGEQTGGNNTPSSSSQNPSSSDRADSSMPSDGSERAIDPSSDYGSSDMPSVYDSELRSAEP